jgi:hypothetical protein
MDIFRSHDLSGWAKVGWIVLIILVPLLGVLIYVITRCDKMKAHEVSSERLQERAFIADVEDLKTRGILTDEEVRRAKKQSQPVTAATPSPDDDLAGLEALKDRGILSDEELKRAKQRALAA